MRADKVSLLAIIAASGLALPSVASAQTGDAADADDGNIIIVTARNREENIQKVPLAIAAFDAEAIARQGIQELDDVARFTPGFSFEDFSGGFAAPVIRGQAQTRVTALESNVSTFLDGVYIPRSWAVDLGTTNLQRVEIVKGPQSARYGRNAFAGAINYLPRKASIDGEISGEIEATVGIDERRDFGAFLNFSVNDYFAIAGSYNYSSFDGSWNNDHPFANLDIDGPSTSGNVGGWDNTAISVSAVVKPLDGIKIEASYNYFDTDNEARASRYLSDGQGDGNCGNTNFGGLPRLICGELPAAGETVINDPRGFGAQAETGIFRFNLEAEITDGLDFSYTFGNVNGDVNIATSGEPDPINCGTVVGPPFFDALCNFQNAPVGDIDYDTHEVRLSYDNGGSIRGAVGGFYSDGTDNFQFASVSIAPITNAGSFASIIDTPVPVGGFFQPGPFGLPLQDDITETEVISVFGELQWTSASGATRIGAEGRYSETEITTTSNLAPLSATNPLNDTFKFFTPRVTFEQDLTEESLIFASVARGAKAGGFNSSAIDPANRVFGPEFNWTYEIGTKNTFMDGRLTLNASAFYTDWSDIQINSADPDATDPNAVTITLNLGDATVYGLELSSRFQATDNLSFDATFSHTEAEYSSGTIDNRFSRTPSPCDDIVCNSNGDVGGNEIERTPPTQASFGAQWDGEIGDDGNYFIRSDVSWQSNFFADSANLGVIPSRFLVNGTVGVNVQNVDVKLWVRNAFDKRYVANAFVVLLPFGNTYGEFFGERRTFGITGGVKF